MATLMTLGGLPAARNRAYSAAQAGLYRLAVQLHRYNNCRMRPWPNLAIAPRPRIEGPEQNVLGLIPT